MSAGNTSVTVDFVLKKMREQERKVFYVKDSMGNVLDYNEDMELKQDAAEEKLQTILEEISGNYAYVTLHARGGGGGKPGGTVKPVLSYKVFIGGGSRIDDRRERGRGNDAGAMMGAGTLGLFERFFTKISDLETKLITQSKDAEIARLTELTKTTKENSHEPAVDMFVKKVFNKYMEYENLKGGGVQQAAPLADNAGNVHEPETGQMVIVIKNFAAFDKDYLQNLVKLSAYAKDNQALYFNLIKGINETGKY